jgi:hypothetical protein
MAQSHGENHMQPWIDSHHLSKQIKKKLDYETAFPFSIQIRGMNHRNLRPGSGFERIRSRPGFVCMARPASEDITRLITTSHLPKGPTLQSVSNQD